MSCKKIDAYGKELIIDLHNCDSSTFTKENIERFFIELCKKIKMKREDLHWWDEEDVPEEERFTEPHLIGISAIQFITTSNITIHTLQLMKRVYLNIFSCKDFNEDYALNFSKDWFKGEVVNSRTIERI